MPDPKTSRTSAIVHVAGLTGVWIALFARAVAGAGDVRQPTAVIPYADAKPTIDGVVGDAEWQGAFSQQALETTKQELSTRNARFWLMWDEENLYVAMRDPLRPHERLLQNLKGFDNDQDEVIHDDCFELWISVGATDPMTKLENMTTQFLGSFTGARFDGLLQLRTGKTRFYSYDTGWAPKSRITTDNAWEMELVIPRASLGTTKGSFHDGLLRFTVTDAAGATLLDWQSQRAFGPMPKDEIKDLAPGASVAETPAPAPKTPAQLGITLGYPVRVAEQTGHLWFPKIDALPGGRLQVVCSGQPDSGETSVAFQTTSADQGKTWAPLAPWRYGGVTSWRDGDLQVGLPWDYAYENDAQTALRGELVAVDASGKNVELPHKIVTITGFPRSLARPSHGHTSSFTTDCDGVVIDGKRILTLGYGRFAGDEAKHRTAGRGKDAFFGYSVIAIESLDGGRNWRYLTTVTDWTHWNNDPHWVDRGRFEGPCESSLVELADGSLLAVYRIGMFEQNPLHQSISTDGGKTWSTPKALPAFSVLPSLKKLANGGLLLAYDRIPMDWQPVPKDSSERNQIFVLPIEVGKKPSH